MTTAGVMVKMIEHNNWASLRIVEACARLSDEQLDARPRPPAEWTIREVLLHIAVSQLGYLALLSEPLETRAERTELAFAELKGSLSESGEGLLALARDETGAHFKAPVRTRDGYVAEPWVVVVQAIDHANHHRKQVSVMLRELGLTPPRIDGWAHGESVGALTGPAPI